jgi:hypothetical protein
MKTSIISKFVLLISVLFLNACAVSNKVVIDSYVLTSSAIDLSTFEKQGIFVTTGDLSQKYKSVSILVSTCYHGYIPNENYKNEPESSSVKKQNYDDLYATPAPGVNLNNYDFMLCTLDDLFAEIISQAKNKGANGIIKLEIRNISRPGPSSKSTQTGLEIVGLAIRIDE